MSGKALQELHLMKQINTVGKASLSRWQGKSQQMIMMMMMMMMMMMFLKKGSSSEKKEYLFRDLHGKNTSNRTVGSLFV